MVVMGRWVGEWVGEWFAWLGVVEVVSREAVL